MAFKREGLDEITRMGQEMDNAELPKPVEVIKCGSCGLPDMVFRRDYDALAERLAAAEARANYNGAEWVKSAEGILALQAKLKALTAAASVVLDNCGTVVVSSDEGTSYYADDALRDAILREAEELK